MKPHYLNASIWVQKSHSGWTVKVYWSSYLKHKTKYLVLVEFAFYLFFIIVYFQVISDVLLQAEQFKIQLYFPVCIQKINENSFFFLIILQYLVSAHFLFSLLFHSCFSHKILTVVLIFMKYFNFDVITDFCRMWCSQNISSCCSQISF